MEEVGAEVIRGCDIIVPVPLHWGRFWKRRGNQAADLACELGGRLDRPVLPHLLRRVVSTPNLAGLSLQARRCVLAGSIRCTRSLSPGKHVVLIDDVMTTGITAQTCSKALYAAGALSVKVLTAARSLVH